MGPGMSPDAVGFLNRCQETYSNECTIFWSHLSRLTNFLVIVNISLFFATGLIKMGYYYTIYSVVFLGLAALGLLIPTPWVKHLWYYIAFVVLDLVGLYFLVVSIVFWVRMSG